MKAHFIIGLTGNIGSGKSSVLNMLRHLGAYGIDADDLARKAHGLPEIKEKIKSQFGVSEMPKLAQIVFKERQALHALEAIIHPMVTRMAEVMIEHSRLPIIVIEAIKLLESDLAAMCDRIWVVDAEENAIINRLEKSRGMSEAEIRERLANQSPITEKRERADTVIENDGNRQATWKQVKLGWVKMGKEGGFAGFAEETIAAMAPFSEYIISPFSDMHEELKYEMKSHSKFTVLPKHEIISRETIDAWICEDFMFNDAPRSESMVFSVWDLSTFQFALRKVILQQGVESEESLPFPPETAEQFAQIERAESLIYPAGLPFNSAKDEEIKKSGFNRCPDEDRHATQWSKAGYNVFYKQIRNMQAGMKDRPTT